MSGTEADLHNGFLTKKIHDMAEMLMNKLNYLFERNTTKRNNIHTEVGLHKFNSTNHGRRIVKISPQKTLREFEKQTVLIIYTIQYLKKQVRMTSTHKHSK